MLASVVLLTGAPLAIAAPKTPEAKAAFDRGVAAYTSNDYAAASAALGQSYALEPDVETLFAWAQTERKLERCDKASELYGKLLAYDLPDENKAAIRTKLEECKTILAAQKPVEPPPPTPDPTPIPPPVDQPPMPPQPRAWWKDPVGGALVGVGVVGLGVGSYFLISARALDADKETAPSYGEFQRLEDKAASRGKLGVIAAAGGGALLVAGIVWYATRGGDGERAAQVSGWVSPDGGGVAAAGRF